MQHHESKRKESQVRAVANQPSTKMTLSEAPFPFVDNRPEATQLKRLQEMADRSSESTNIGRFQAMIDKSSTIVAQRQEETTEDEQLSELDKRLNQTELTFRRLISGASSIGWDIAADNLRRYMAGEGGTKRLWMIWLRGFSAVTAAEQVNQRLFESSMDQAAIKISDGETRSFMAVEMVDPVVGNPLTELFWASGLSRLRSYGNFLLTREGSVITINGNVGHHWFDKYDWHLGLGVRIPGFGYISDEQALLLKRHRKAADFMMEADWSQIVHGIVRLGSSDYFISDYDWGPSLF